MKKYILSLLVGLSGTFTFAQTCAISVTPSDTTICSGSTVTINAFAQLVNSNQSFNFNGGVLPAGWSAGGGNAFTAPCGANPSGSNYYWASTSTTTPNITTASFDVSCGGVISFDMVYSVQSGPTPCEGPDQLNEGVQLQYSTDGGGTWNTILYYQPDGVIATTYNTSTTSAVTPGQTTPFTTWATYNINIPPVALSTGTQFRWIQVSSSSNLYDNWGLDNILINATGAPCGSNAIINWSNGLTNTTSFDVTTTVDTTFIAMVYDTAGNYMCSSAPITIQVVADNIAYNLQDTVYSYCPTTNPLAAVTNITGGLAPYTTTWTTLPSSNASVNLPTGGVEHDTITFPVIIQDACGYIRNDNVVLIVNKILNVDSVESVPTSACANDGVVIAYVSGQQGQPLYNWNGPGVTNPSFTNSTVWQNRPTGWYYFIVTDNFCSDRDSVFVDILPPPTATGNATPNSGCVPFQVVFENTSQNATNYFWDFDNGNTASVGNLDDQVQTFSANATVMLVAFSSPTCSDTTYIPIGTIICGCTSTEAINYNPTAQQDNGSCIFPDPEVVLPNVFTPNDDATNGIYEVKMKNVSSIKLTITNRWGNVVFSAEGVNPTWDGKANGNPVSEGVYFVIFEAINTSKTKTITGQSPVTVIR